MPFMKSSAALQPGTEASQLGNRPRMIASIHSSPWNRTSLHITKGKYHELVSVSGNTFDACRLVAPAASGVILQRAERLGTRRVRLPLDKSIAWSINKATHALRLMSMPSLNSPNPRGHRLRIMPQPDAPALRILFGQGILPLLANSQFRFMLFVEPRQSLS